MCVHRGDHRTGNCRICVPPPTPEFRDLLERSSLGTPAAKAARASVPDEVAARVVARSHEIRRESVMPQLWSDDGDDS